MAAGSELTLEDASLEPMLRFVQCHKKIYSKGEHTPRVSPDFVSEIKDKHYYIISVFGILPTAIMQQC